MPPARAVIAAAVIVDSGRVLLVRRRQPEGDLVWQFPAGKVEPGEDPSAAAVRETREETGLSVHARHSLGQRVHPTTFRAMAYIACELVPGEQASRAHVAAATEVAEVAWSDPATLAARIGGQLHEPVQRYLAKSLG